MVRQIAIELETPGDSRTMFRLRIDGAPIADDLTAAQAHVLVGEILERITLPKSSEGAPLATEFGLRRQSASAVALARAVATARLCRHAARARGCRGVKRGARSCVTSTRSPKARRRSATSPAPCDTTGTGLMRSQRELGCFCCGYVGNAFALSKRSGISTALAAASILSMPARHTAIGIWLFIAW